MSDVIVVGGGPAGSSLAVMLGRRGLSVELYEQSRFPRDKPCGEGLLPPGLRVLRALGLEQAVGGRPLRGVRYHVGGGSVHAGFEASPEGSLTHGLGQKRLVLDSTLFAAAARTPGVLAHDGTRVERLLLGTNRVSGVVVDGEPRFARLVVASDGSASSLRRSLGLERAGGRRRVGIRAHFRRPQGSPPLDGIEIFMRRGYELYVTPLPDDEVVVAALAYQDVVRGNLREAFLRWLHAERRIRDWLEGAVQTSELMGRAPLVRRSATRSPPGLVLLGDAESSVDPITAGGMSLALVSASLLATELPDILAGSDAATRRFESARKTAVRVHRWLGAGLLALARHPALASTTRRLMHACPSGMHALVRLASEGGSR